MNEEEVRTLEARRQLIWAAKREGYLMAIEDLEYSGRIHEFQPAIRYLVQKIMTASDLEEIFRVP